MDKRRRKNPEMGDPPLSISASNFSSREHQDRKRLTENCPFAFLRRWCRIFKPNLMLRIHSRFFLSVCPSLSLSLSFVFIYAYFPPQKYEWNNEIFSSLSSSSLSSAFSSSLSLSSVRFLKNFSYKYAWFQFIVAALSDNKATKRELTKSHWIRALTETVSFFSFFYLVEPSSYFQF